MQLLLVASSLTWRLNLSQFFIVWSFKYQRIFYYFLRIVQNIFPSHLRCVLSPKYLCSHDRTSRGKKRCPNPLIWLVVVRVPLGSESCWDKGTPLQWLASSRHFSPPLQSFTWLLFLFLPSQYTVYLGGCWPPHTPSSVTTCPSADSPATLVAEKNISKCC